MKKKITVRALKRMISEALESDDGSFKEVTDDSLDNQIDRYLGQYEGEAKKSKLESVSFRDFTRRFLREADEDTDEEASGDEGAAGGSEQPPTKLTAEDLDIEAFVVSVVRLVENYESLLEFRDTIVRRAKNFLGKSYDEDVVQMFDDILREDHGIVDGKSDEDVADEEFSAPTGERGGLDPNAGGGAV